MYPFASIRQRFLAEYIEKLNSRERKLLYELEALRASRTMALAAYTAEDSKA